MELYLAADSGRLQQAMACTTQLAHMSYRIGPGGTLLASPLPDTLRGASAGLGMSCWPGRGGGCICRRLRRALPPTARRSSAPPSPPAAWRSAWPQPPKSGARSAWPWTCSG